MAQLLFVERLRGARYDQHVNALAGDLVGDANGERAGDGGMCAMTPSSSSGEFWRRPHDKVLVAADQFHRAVVANTRQIAGAEVIAGESLCVRSGRSR